MTMTLPSFCQSSNSNMRALTALLFIWTTAVITIVHADPPDFPMTKEEVYALTRDNFKRKNPDALLNGFFPVWAVIQLILGGIFLVVLLLALICYFLGYRTPVEEPKKPAM